MICAQAATWDGCLQVVWLSFPKRRGPYYAHKRAFGPSRASLGGRSVECWVCVRACRGVGSLCFKLGYHAALLNGDSAYYQVCA